MKQLYLIVVIMLTVGLVGSCEDSRPLRVEVSGRANPWTHLRLNNDPGNFQFAIVGDRTGGARPGIFEDAVGKLNLLRPEFVMSIGDLIEGYSEDRDELNKQWDQFNGMVGELEMPFFYVVGNHDIANDVMVKNWNRHFGRNYYHFVYRNVLFLCLDSEDPPRGHEFSNFGDAQLNYFKDVLQKNKDVRWTLLFLHKPMWQYGDSTNWTKMEKLLSGRSYTVFSGHKHRYAKAIRNGQSYYRLATTGGVSKLAGPKEGSFDHIVWVTMTDEGPKVVNLMLDGIFDDDPTK